MTFNDTDKQVLMSDIQRWIDARPPGGVRVVAGRAADAGASRDVAAESLRGRRTGKLGRLVLCYVNGLHSLPRETAGISRFHHAP
jgi:hypothetical protein